MSDTIKHFENGAPVWAKIGKRLYAATVLDSSNISTREHGYELFKLELQHEYTDLAGNTKTHKWVHPMPVQGYKLRKRVIEEGEEVKP